MTVGRLFSEQDFDSRVVLDFVLSATPILVVEGFESSLDRFSELFPPSPLCLLLTNLQESLSFVRLVVLWVHACVNFVFEL